MSNLIKVDFKESNRSCIEPAKQWRVSNSVIDAKDRFKPKQMSDKEIMQRFTRTGKFRPKPNEAPRLQRIKESLNKINKLMSELRISAHDDYTLGIIGRFNGAKPRVRRDSAYAAGLNDYEVSITLSFDAASVPKVGKRYAPTKKYEQYMGHLVIDVNNYLYRCFGLPVHRPSVRWHRASKGIKRVTFTYRMVKLDKATVADLKDRKICSNY